MLAEAQHEWAVSEPSSIPFERIKTQVVDANAFRARNDKAGEVNANGSCPRLRVNENIEPKFKSTKTACLGVFALLVGDRLANGV